MYINLLLTRTKDEIRRSNFTYFQYITCYAFYVQAVYWTQNRNRKLKVTGIINDKSKVWRSSYGDGEWFSDTRPYSLEF